MNPDQVKNFELGANILMRLAITTWADLEFVRGALLHYSARLLMEATPTITNTTPNTNWICLWVNFNRKIGLVTVCVWSS